MLVVELGFSLRLRERSGTVRSDVTRTSQIQQDLSILTIDVEATKGMHNMYSR